LYLGVASLLFVTIFIIYLLVKTIIIPKEELELIIDYTKKK